MGQRLPVPVFTEPCGYRLDRLTLPVGKQPPQVDLPPTTLVITRERLEHLRGWLEVSDPS